MKEDYYYLKYQKVKERLLNNTISLLENHLEYTFQNENYISKIKLLEFEMLTIEFFYNIYFNRFNIDSWLDKSILSCIKLPIEKILMPFNNSNQLNKIQDYYSLGFFQNLRNYLMFNCLVNKKITIYSTSLQISYICIITPKTITLFNKYHNFNKIVICEEEIILEENIDKHTLLQFLINPFWCVESSEMNIKLKNTIINPDWNLINISENIFINSTLKNFNKIFIDKYINPKLDENIVNINQIIDLFYYILNLENINYIIKFEIWKTLINLRNKIEHNEEYIIVQEENEQIDNKQIIYSFSKPIFNLYEHLIQNKRNVFTKREIEMFNESNLVDLNPFDLGIVLPIIVDDKYHLIDICHCFFINSYELPKDSIRKDIILSQIPNANGKKCFTTYGIKYLLEANNRKIKIKSHFIWNETLWLFNLKMMELSEFDIFDLINDQTWLTYKNLLTLFELQISDEAKIVGLLICYQIQSFENIIFYYLEYNLNELMIILKNNITVKINLNKNKIATNEFIIDNIDYEISTSQLYANYLINNTDIHDILITDTNYINNVIQKLCYSNIFYECNTICKHIKKSFKLNYLLNINNSNIKLSNLTRNFENIWDLLLIDGHIQAFKYITINYYLKEFSISFNNNKVFINKITNENEYIILTVEKEDNLLQYILAELMVEIII
jgi:hypothetical protein